MKTRSSFVSNSSSSNFILAIKKTEPCPHCHRSDPDLENLFPHNYCGNSDGTELLASSTDITELMSKIESAFYDEEITKIIKDKIQKQIEAGYKVIYFQVSYHDEAFQKLIDSQIESGAAIVLHSTEG